MESATTLHGVSFRKVPRRGQVEAFNLIAADLQRNYLTTKLPTGYGKTLLAAGCYAILKQCRVNRVLYITPRIAQHNAIITNGIHDFADAGLTIAQPVDVMFYDIAALRKHTRNEAEVYAMTIQALCGKNGRSLATELLQRGDWLIVIDEYHHFGVDKKWGEAIKHLRSLPGCRFTLAMSATPNRPNEDGIFSTVDIDIGYREAANAGDIKPLRGYGYVYRIDAIEEDGTVHTMTTDELIGLAGGNDPEKIEKVVINRKLRWSPKYVSPLVSVPIERMLSERLKTGLPSLQNLITAMSVSHAKVVCEQVRSMYPDLRVDWVGTGTNGRTDEENQKVLDRFCPPKKLNAFGHVAQETPTLDILVHVGIAGEGLDTRWVSELTFLCQCNLTNTTFQIIGRGSRAISYRDKDGALKMVVCHVNFDSGGEMADKGYFGSTIMDAMDLEPPRPDDDDGAGSSDDDGDREISDLPEIEDIVSMLNITLDHIEDGVSTMPDDSPQFERMAETLKKDGARGDWDNYRNDPETIERVREMYKNVHRADQIELNEKAQVANWRDIVSGATSKVTGDVVRIMSGATGRFEKSLPGDIKKRINRQKAISCGNIINDIDALKRHYLWLKALETTLQDHGIPEWLL